MNRRFFMKALGAAGTLALLPISLTITACSFSVTGMLNTILAALQGIVNVVEPNASWLPDLQNVITKVQAAIQSWTSGGVIATVEEVMNDVAAVLAVIPLTAIYSPLIDVIVAGIDAVLNYFGTAQAKDKFAAINNPHRGRVKLNKSSFLHSQQGAFKEQFNEVAVGLGLSKAKIA